MRPEGLGRAPADLRMERGPLALVIDGDSEESTRLSSILRDSGFRMVVVDSGAEALARFRMVAPELMMIAVRLPDMDGFEACERLRALPGAPGIPVVFIADHDDAASKLRGLSIAGADYVTRPFEVPEIQKRLRLHMGIRQARQRSRDEERHRRAELRQSWKRTAGEQESLPGARCAIHYQPSQDVEGDRCDVADLGSGRLRYFMADIHTGEAPGLKATEKVLDEGFDLSLIEAALHDSPGTPPEALLSSLNAAILTRYQGEFTVSASILILDRERFQATLVAAGQLPLLLARPDGRVEEWIAEGEALGSTDSPVFHPSTMKAQAGLRFWLYTDGVVEEQSMGRTRRMGIGSLAARIAGSSGRPLAQALTTVVSGFLPEGPGGADRLLLLCEM